MAHIGIIGGTGAVGQECVRLIRLLGIKHSSLSLFASSKSDGQEIQIDEEAYTIKSLEETSLRGLDYALFCTDSSLSLNWIPIALQSSCKVIDFSPSYRLDPDIPLVIPEINGHLLQKGPELTTSPNCTATIALMALAPLHKAFALKRFWLSSYQAVSGVGLKGKVELKKQIHSYLNHQPIEPIIFQAPIAFNLIPLIGSLGEDGYTEEEHKIANECQKILDLKNLKVSSTCVRVPTLRSHGISIHAEFERPLNLKTAQNALSNQAGLHYTETIEDPLYPLPLQTNNQIFCSVGRLRKDSALENGLAFWVCGDQLWKGAALNGIQILQQLIALNPS